MSEAQGKLLQGEMNMTLNMTIMTSARDAVGKCLATLGGEYDNMLVLTADVDTSSRIRRSGKISRPLLQRRHCRTRT